MPSAARLPPPVDGAIVTLMTTPADRLSVLYDADCGVCRLTARALALLDWRGRLDIRPLQRFAGPAGSPSRVALLTSLHARDERGRWFAGGDAALRIARSVPVLSPLWLAGRLPFGHRLADVAYRLVASHRHELSRALRVDRRSFEAMDRG